MPLSNQDLRKTLSATLNEMIQSENKFRDIGMQIIEDDEWQQLGDIVARVLRKAQQAEEEINPLL